MLGAMDTTATLRELGIDKDNFRTLGLLPLVFVAWADGTVQRAEGALIHKVARDKGWLVGGGEALLDRWLRDQPDPEYIATGLRLLRTLTTERRGLGGVITTETLNHLLVLCKDVAEAAGGLWGLSNPIDPSEEQALASIAEAFEIGDATTWRRMVAEIESNQIAEAPGPKGNILVGDLLALASDPLGLLMRCLNEHGDVVHLQVPGRDWFLITRPEHVRHVLVDQARNYVRGASYERIRLIVGDSIVTTDGEQWRSLRRIAQPAFHRESVMQMAGMMRRCADEMVESWTRREQPEASFDLALALQQLTLRVIGLALFSVDLQAKATHEFGEALEVALEYAAGSANPFRLPKAVPTPGNLRYTRALKVFDRFVFDVLASRREVDEQPHDLLAMLLDATDPETGAKLGPEQLRNEALTYLLAGHETSATTLTWLFFLLSRHPTIARRVDDELARVLAGAAPTFEQLDQLEYLEQVLLETMRLYPAAYMLTREVLSEDRIGGYTIPAKSWVLLAPYVTHRRPDVWANPEGFDPDRFLPEAIAKQPACAYFPFFAGAHKCVGQTLAMMEMKMIVVTVLQRCRLDLLPGFEPEVDPQVTLRAKHGLWMRPYQRGPAAG